MGFGRVDMGPQVPRLGSSERGQVPRGAYPPKNPGQGMSFQFTEVREAKWFREKLLEPVSRPTTNQPWYYDFHRESPAGKQRVASIIGAVYIGYFLSFLVWESPCVFILYYVSIMQMGA